MAKDKKTFGEPETPKKDEDKILQDEGVHTNEAASGEELLKQLVEDSQKKVC